jgi:pimeloyl-ACP methyl ester carboxylesterase
MERIVDANGIKICIDDFGDASDPALILCAGATSSSVLFRDEFCSALAAGGRHVVRYDARDTGRSTSMDFDTHPYTLPDMAEDLVGILDAIGVAAAHVVGQSMGGMVCQEVAIRHPDRVLTLTAIMSSPAVVVDVGGVWSGGLPPIEPRLLQPPPMTFSDPPTEDEIFEATVWNWKNLAGTLESFDEEAYAALIRRGIERKPAVDTSGNHSRAMAASEDRTAALASVTAPTLVIHGTEDPAVPLPHGEALANAVAGARLLRIEHWGHEVILGAAQDIIVPAILEHTAPR